MTTKKNQLRRADWYIDALRNRIEQYERYVLFRPVDAPSDAVQWIRRIVAGTNGPRRECMYVCSDGRMVDAGDLLPRIKGPTKRILIPPRGSGRA